MPDDRPREIIGVVRDRLAHPFATTVRPTMYALYDQQPVHNRGPYGGERLRMGFVVRTDEALASVIPRLRHAIAEVEPDHPVTDLRSLDEVSALQLKSPRFTAAVLGLFAIVATTLAAIGLFGVMAHTVSRRTREIGIRVALGASEGTVLRTVGRQILVITGTGLALGVAGAFVLTPFLEPSLWEVAPLDPLTHLTTATLMVIIAVTAGFLPARRAGKVDPLVTLRAE